MYEKSKKLKDSLQPQSLLDYKKDSQMTKTSKQMLFAIQNDKFIQELERLNKEKEVIMKERMKRLKYLYRKKTKGVTINLRTINQSTPGDPKEGQFKRIKQYEHYICKKIGFINRRRELLHEAECPDPTKRYQALKTVIQEKEEEELRNLIEYFERDDESRNNLSFKVILISYISFYRLWKS